MALVGLVAMLVLVARGVPGHVLVTTAAVALVLSLIVVWVERGALAP